MSSLGYWINNFNNCPRMYHVPSSWSHGEFVVTWTLVEFVALIATWLIAIRCTNLLQANRLIKWALVDEVDESSMIWQPVDSQGLKSCSFKSWPFFTPQDICRKAVLSPSSKASVLSSIWLVKVCSPVSALLSSRQSEAWSLTACFSRCFASHFSLQLPSQNLRLVDELRSVKIDGKTHEALVRFTTQFVPIRGPRFHPALVLWVP